MARRQIARVEQFNIPGLPWDFVDIRTLSEQRQALARDLIIELAQSISSDVGRIEEVKHCAQLALEESPPPEICEDPNRPFVSLIAVNRQGRPVGGIHADDMRIERDEPGLLRARARPSPGLPAVGIHTQYKVYGKVMRWLLANNLTLMNGKELDIVQWILPRGRRFRWTSKGRPAMLECFSEIEIDADRESSPDDADSPVEYRRKGVPPDSP
jgi:hypothetical protein